jgi:uncharacterized protein YprB with RNaseH-like and TPR domain
MFNLQDTFSSLQSICIPLLTKHQFPAEISVRRILIFDLETTGLAGGTGTYPFLIGFGRFETEGIRLFQYFLPDYGREISAFLDMRCLFEDKNVLLSFNGKSFDFPLLRNRMIMNRMENPLASFAHLDLLHPARRLWRDVLPSCSLDIIEEEIFLFSRYQDIDGALIPQAYFDFLQTGNTAQIRQIIMHNQQDLISLGRLLFLMHQIENHHPLHGHSPSELLAMFDVAVDMSDLVRIATILKKLEHSRRKIPDHSLLKYSLLLKRLQKWDEALLIWHGFLERSSEILFVAEELAKYYEHRENDLKQAIEYTNRALQYMDLMSEISGQNERSAEARKKFMHRLWRLNAKLKIKS